MGPEGGKDWSPILIPSALPAACQARKRRLKLAITVAIPRAKIIQDSRVALANVCLRKTKQK
jgi:hypothetical protein